MSMYDGCFDPAAYVTRPPEPFVAEALSRLLDRVNKKTSGMTFGSDVLLIRYLYGRVDTFSVVDGTTYSDRDRGDAAALPVDEIARRVMETKRKLGLLAGLVYRVSESMRAGAMTGELQSELLYRQGYVFKLNTDHRYTVFDIKSDRGIDTAEPGPQ